MHCLHDEFNLKLPDDEGNRTIELTAENLSELIAFLASDNCSANRTLANRSGIPLSGCNSHRLHLSVEGDFIGPVQKKNRNGDIIQEESELRSLVRLIISWASLKN
jgi:hypothetical protein